MGERVRSRSGQIAIQGTTQGRSVMNVYVDVYSASGSGWRKVPTGRNLFDQVLVLDRVGLTDPTTRTAWKRSWRWVMKW